MKHKISDAEWSLREDLAAAYNLADIFGWTDLIYTHISVRVPEEDSFLMNPFGLFFHEITPENLVKVDFEGNVLCDSEYGINKAGFVVHGALHMARPDISSICHFHTQNGMTISALDVGLLPISQHACHFYDEIAYHDFHGIAFEDDEREKLIKSIGDSSILIMRNHGFLTAGHSIGDAFVKMYTLEKAASAQILAMSTGANLVHVGKKVCNKVIQQTGKHSIKNVDVEWNALKRLLVSQKKPNLETLDPAYHTASVSPFLTAQL